MRYAPLLFILVSLLAHTSDAAEPRLRPANWATPVISEHLNNWHKVDSRVYRSEQPDSRAMAEIEAFGIKRILNLREFHNDNDEIRKTSLKSFRVPIKTSAINDDHIVQALRIISSSDEPILVHCWHGADRTGTVIAMYRIIYQGWSREQAIDELVNGGYNYHTMFDNIIAYLQNVDIERIRQRLKSRN